jgi:hypothetical protein
MVLQIYSPEINPRVRYAFKLLFDIVVRIPYRLTDEWRENAPPLLSYTASPPSKVSLWLPSSGFLQQPSRRPLSPQVFNHFGLPAFFAAPSPDSLLPFDLPALAFYLASRYEEYQPFAADEHGRFPARASLAARNGFLKQPLIQQWGLRLAEKLQLQCPDLKVNKPQYQFRPTYDIDMAWAYQHRPLWLQAAGAGRDFMKGNWPLIRQRCRVLRRAEADPFDTFRYLQAQHEYYGLHPIYFFLLGDYSRYDKNITANHPALRSRLGQLAEHYDTGLHPSYRSNGQPAQLARECQRYAHITSQAPWRSRQHFLRLHLPDTYRALLREGIAEDYTMGFADDVGFRAGMALPFPWYDLECESERPLKIFPFPLMDGTLRNYLKLDPCSAKKIIAELIDATRDAGGQFLPLWHNSSFSALHGWGSWKEVYEELLAYASANF